MLQSIRTVFVGWLVVLFACTPLICLRICALRHALPTQPVDRLHGELCGGVVAPALPHGHGHIHEHIGHEAHTVPLRDDGAEHSQTHQEAQQMLLSIIEFLIAATSLCCVWRWLRFRLAPRAAPPDRALSPPRMPPRCCPTLI